MDSRKSSHTIATHFGSSFHMVCILSLHIPSGGSVIWVYTSLRGSVTQSLHIPLGVVFTHPSGVVLLQQSLHIPSGVVLLLEHAHPSNFWVMHSGVPSNNLESKVQFLYLQYTQNCRYNYMNLDADGSAFATVACGWSSGKWVICNHHRIQHTQVINVTTHRYINLVKCVGGNS